MTLSPLRRDAGADIKNDLELQFFGLQRSGNHAVATWVFQQFDEPVLFLNNVTQFSDPYTNFHIAAVPNTVELNRSSPAARARIERLRAARKPVLAYSYENLVPARLARQELVPGAESCLGRSARVCRIVLLRDFYNWVASRIKLFEYRLVPLETVRDRIDVQVDLWLAYAREFAGETQFLAGERTVKIAYHRWARDAAYRTELLQRLEIPLRDNGIAHVPDVGGGSSFDATALSGHAGQMQIEQRWRYLLDDRIAPITAKLRARAAELDAYNLQLFGIGSPLAPGADQARQ